MEIQVIEKTNGRINRVTGTTIKERLRVCAYCRVSTGNEEQLNSYQSQLKYYDEKINSKSEWQFAGIYADDWKIIKKLADNKVNTLYFRDTNLVKLEESRYIKEVNNWGEIYRYIKEMEKIENINGNKKFGKNRRSKTGF